MDVLGLDDAALAGDARGAPPYGLPASATAGHAEALQVVRYEVGQTYLPHLDFEAGSTSSRILTLLLYVSPPESGGHTSFPKADGGRGLRILPPKGSGLLFYSMLPDGNGDALSLHSGERVVQGSKWVCNLWIWDHGVPSASEQE